MEPTVSYLFSADDNLLFGHVPTKNCQAINDCVQQYDEAWGHKINLSKSAAVFRGNVGMDERSRMIVESS